MEIQIIWQAPSTSTVDLLDYGHDEDKNWNYLSVSDRDEILDHLRSEIVPMIKDIRSV